MTGLDGLDEVVQVTGDVTIQNNPMLSTLSGLQSLTYIGGRLTVTGNGDANEIDISTSRPSAAQRLSVVAYCGPYCDTGRREDGFRCSRQYRLRWRSGPY